MKSKAPLMLMEQIVMLLVFAIAAALCVQAFVKSEEISARSEAKDRAVLEVQTAAETLRYYSGDYAKAAGELGYQSEGSGFAACFDEEWNLLPAGVESWTYELTAEALDTEVPGLGCAGIRVASSQREEALFSTEIMWQEVSAHAQEG